jgi:hypothetical protein
MGRKLVILAQKFPLWAKVKLVHRRKISAHEPPSKPTHSINLPKKTKVNQTIILWISYFLHKLLFCTHPDSRILNHMAHAAIG